MGILRAEKSMVRTVCGVRFRYLEIVKELMLILGFNETMNQFDMASGVC